jgi:hypothetical protein
MLKIIEFTIIAYGFRAKLANINRNRNFHSSSYLLKVSNKRKREDDHDEELNDWIRSREEAIQLQRAEEEQREIEADRLRREERGGSVSTIDMDEDEEFEHITGLMIQDAYRLSQNQPAQHFNGDSRMTHVEEIAEMINTGEKPTVEGLKDYWNKDDDNSVSTTNNNNNINVPVNSPSSLIDDFADPNLEQPSHMDSED